jgi:hypothetical protein
MIVTGTNPFSDGVSIPQAIVAALQIQLAQ